MGKIYYDLSENEFSKERKVLLWLFCIIFFLAGLGMIYLNIIANNIKIHISYSIAPFGISLFVGIIAYLSSAKRKNHYFLIDDDKIEYRFGLLKPVMRTFSWNGIKEIHMAHRQKKIRLVYNESEKPVINITWLERKKTVQIRKCLFYFARDKKIPVKKFNYL